MERLRRLIARARVEKVEVNILRGMLGAWDRPRGK
jgi:tRNA C32,U32 (ribose-2'-O)-methylase TrmJ